MNHYDLLGVMGTVHIIVGLFVLCCCCVDIDGTVFLLEETYEVERGSNEKACGSTALLDGNEL